MDDFAGESQSVLNATAAEIVSGCAAAVAGVPLECVCLCGDSPANPPAKGSVARTPTAQPPESSVRGSLLQLLAGVAAAWAAEITRSPDKAAAKAARTAAAEVRALLALWLPEGLTGAASAAR